MGRFDKFIQKITPGFIKKSLLSNPYTGDFYYGNFGGEVNVGTGTAETISAFFTCLRIKSETAGVIGTYLYETLNERTSRKKGKLDDLLSTQPNKHTNAFTFWSTIQLHEDLWGNAYAEIKFDRAGEIASLEILEPWHVRVSVVNRSLVYKYKDRTINGRKILHFKQNCKDGYMGRSLVSIQRDTLALRLKQQNYAMDMVGAKPPAMFEGGEGLNAKTAQEAAEGFQKQIDAGVMPVAFGGLKFRNIMMPAGDVQLFEMGGFTTSDIYGMFRMPESKAGNYSREAGATYNNVEQQNRNFVQDVVMPMIKQKQNECDIKLLTPTERETLNIEFDYSELIQADFQTMKEVSESMLSRAVMNPNEVRRKFLRMNRIDEAESDHGDRYFIQAGFIPVDRADDFIGGTEPEKKKINGHAFAEN